MAVQDTAPQTDKDLTSIAEARSLARAARQAQPLLAELSQDQIDRIVSMMAELSWAGGSVQPPGVMATSAIASEGLAWASCAMAHVASVTRSTVTMAKPASLRRVMFSLRPWKARTTVSAAQRDGANQRGSIFGLPYLL